MILFLKEWIESCENRIICKIIKTVKFHLPFVELFFNNDEASKTITITILQDSEPELSEVITVRLTDVKLIPTRLTNYSVVNGIQIDMPPRIGPESVVNITIVENDDARGIIEFKESAKIASERDGVVVLDLERKGIVQNSVSISQT